MRQALENHVVSSQFWSGIICMYCLLYISTKYIKTSFLNLFTDSATNIKQRICFWKNSTTRFPFLERNFTFTSPTKVDFTTEAVCRLLLRKLLPCHRIPIILRKNGTKTGEMCTCR